MNALPLPRLLSLADWEALPYDPEKRYELVKGVLEVTGRPSPMHQVAQYRLAGQFDDQLPGDLACVSEIQVLLTTGWFSTIRVPDLAVVPTKLFEAGEQLYEPTDVLLAVEIVSPTSEDRDRVTKFCEYADAGIQAYWVIDLAPRPKATVYRLRDGEYQLVTTSEWLVKLTEPVAMTVDISTLLPHLH